MNWLDALADLASIVTAIVAGGAAALYWHGRRERRGRLEDYLRNIPGRDSGRANAVEVPLSELMAKLGMTEAQVLEAAFGSRKIEPEHRGGAIASTVPIQQALVFKHKDD